MVEWVPIYSVLGGGLIGLSALLLLWLNGRIAGISGIAAGLLQSNQAGNGWRWLFLLGLVLGPIGVQLIGPDLAQAQLPAEIDTAGWVLALAGGLVGVGTRLGSGCTSGHGICGIGRLSPRSIVATLIFMGSAGATVFLLRHVVG